jgi:hypothetical protein
MRGRVWTLEGERERGDKEASELLFKRGRGDKEAGELLF